MKRVISFALAAALTLTPALAHDHGAFPHVNEYHGFTDLEGHWCAPYAQSCFETGLMKGTDTGFAPQQTMTVAECAIIASRIHKQVQGDIGIQMGENAQDTWYSEACAYMHAVANAAGDEATVARLGSPLEPASRKGFLDLLALAVGDDLLSPINSVTALPDTTDADVLAFYNAGILTGVNTYGTFRGGGTLTRGECAAMVARITDAGLRLSFTPVAADPHSEGFDACQYFLGMGSGAPLYTFEGLTVSAGSYLSNAIAAGNSLYNACAQQGVTFHWNNTIGGTDFISYALMYANSNGVYASWMADRGEKIAATEADIAACEEQGLLKAKHILVSDKDTADMLYDFLQGDPTQFDALLAVYGEDPGMESNPGGYVFGPGEMVSEFENGTKALGYNQISAPVQSTYGYHIILRLPLTAADVTSMVREAAWTEFAQGSRYEGYAQLVDGIEINAIYDNYLTME